MTGTKQGNPGGGGGGGGRGGRVDRWIDRYPPGAALSFLSDRRPKQTFQFSHFQFFRAIGVGLGLLATVVLT